MTVSRRLLRSMVVPAPISTSFWIRTRPVCGTFRWPSGPKKKKRYQSCLVWQPGWIDDGRGCDAGVAEPGLRAKGVAVQLARNFHEFAKRLGRAQHRNMGGDTGFEPLADQARPGLRRRELVGIFQVVEKCQMHRAGFVERS